VSVGRGCVVSTATATATGVSGVLVSSSTGAVPALVVRGHRGCDEARVDEVGRPLVCGALVLCRGRRLGLAGIALSCDY